MRTTTCLSKKFRSHLGVNSANCTNNLTVDLQQEKIYCSGNLFPGIQVCKDLDACATYMEPSLVSLTAN